MSFIVDQSPFFVPPHVPNKLKSSVTIGRDHQRRNSGAISIHSQQKSRKCIGDYIVGKTLGKGASGRVKLGVHRYTGDQVAIKIISKAHLAANPAIEKAVRREIAIMKLIHHPNVMSLIDVIDDPASSDLYLILEYVEGGELFEYLVKKGRLSESEARHHFQQIILGLDYCHHYLICHRDLKPENLLLDNHNNIRIADFGMASLQPLGSLLETSCGSPHYASPEIVTGIPYEGSSCDIWSCGVILYALLTGHLPFDDENIRLLLKKVKLGKYVMPQDISLSAQDLIKRILVVDPSKRLTMKQIMEHPWFKETKPMNLSVLPVPPTPEEIGQPVLDASEIDDRILETIKFLWGESDNETVIQALIQTEHNMQKVIYVLLQQHAERYWQTNHTDSDDEDSDRHCYNTIRIEQRPPLPTDMPFDDTIKNEQTMKKSETFYTKLVKHVLPKRQQQSRNVIEPISSSSPSPATVTIKSTLVGTLRRKNPFQRTTIIKEEPLEIVESKVPLKGLSLRIPNALNTMNSKKFGFTLGRNKQRQQLDLSMFRRSSQASFQSRSSHSSSTQPPPTPSLMSANSSNLPSPITPKSSWLDPLFLFKQPKVCSIVVYHTHTETILKTLHRLMNKTVEARFYEKLNRSGTPRYKADIKKVVEGTKGRQVKCRIDLIKSELDTQSCAVRFTQQQGDGALLQMIIQQLHKDILEEFPYPA